MTLEAHIVSKRRLWTGWIMTGMALLFLLFDSTIHLMMINPVIESFKRLGFPVEFAATVGILELVSLVIYAIPRVSVLGAILLTGYLGGAVASQLRIGAPLFSTALFPVYIGILVWGGLYLRDNRVRALISFQQ